MARLGFEMWALPLTGPAVQLPDLAGWEVAPADTGDWGSISFDYPVAGRNYALLDALVADGRDLEVEIAFTDDDNRQWLKRGLLLDIDTDDVADTGMATVTGALLEYLFGEVRTPYHPTGENGETPVSGTAGRIMRELMQAAQARGCLAGVTWSFTDSADSNGDPWANTATMRFSPGQTYAAILGTLRGYQLSAWGLTADRELRLTNPDGKGFDRTVAGGPLPVVTLEHGRDLADAPRKFSLRNAITALLSAGKDGLYSSASNATAQAVRGRRIEGYRSFGNAADTGTLAALTQGRLSTSTSGTTAVSHEVTLADGGPLPLLDYGLADWVLSATRRGVERRRVMQLTISGDGDEAVSCAIDLDAVLDDALLSQAQRLDALENGSATVGTSVPPPDVDDGSIPDQVDGLTVTSLWYSTGEGVGLSSVLAGWTPIPDDRIDGYVVEWRYSSEPVPPTSSAGTEKAQAAATIRARMLSGDPIAEDWTWTGAPTVVGRWNDVLLDEFEASGAASATTWLGTYAPAQSSSGWRRQQLVEGSTTAWGSVTAGAGVRVRVAAQNRWARLGPWSTVVEITTELDGTPPPVASTPAAYAALGLVMVPWDGHGAAGEAMPGDFAVAEIHISATSGFTESRPLVGGKFNPAASTTYAGELRAAGEWPIDVGQAGYGTTFYVKLVTRDRTGNAAAASAQGTVVARPVQDGEIAGMSIGKLTVGIMSAIMTISGIIRTAAAGARVELDTAGLRCIAADGRILFEFSIPNSLLTVVGRLIAGAGIGVGATIVVDPTGPALDFYPDATNRRARLRAYTSTRPGGGSGPSVLLASQNSGGVDDGPVLNMWTNGLWLHMKNTAGQNRGGRLVLGRPGGGDLDPDELARITYERSDGQTSYVSAEFNAVILSAPDDSDIYATRAMGTSGGFSQKLQSGADAGVRGYYNGSDGTMRFVDNQGSGSWMRLGDGGGAYKNFVIDHPTDPDRWLVHACTEGPSAGVEYHGVVDIVDHTATVELPPYFEAATCPDGRVVLVSPELPTERERVLADLAPLPSDRPVIDAREDVEIPEWSRLPIVAASPPTDGRFRITSSQPSGRVTWRVFAVRSDAAPLDPEPLRSEVDVHGDGPYRHLTPKLNR